MCHYTLTHMPRFAVDMPDDLNKEFRVRVVEIYGSQKGSVTRGVQDAIRLWIKETKKTPKKAA